MIVPITEVIIKQEGDIGELKACNDDYQRDRGWFMGILATIFGVLILSQFSLAGCVQIAEQIVSTRTPVATSTSSATPTVIPTVIGEPTPTPTPKPEAFYTPTPITPTSPITEVTPIGGQTSNWQILPSDTWFRVTATILKVRSCASTTCALLDRYGAGKEVVVLSRLRTKTSTDEWLCLTELEMINNVVTCPKAIAHIYNNQQLGVLLMPEVMNE